MLVARYLQDSNALISNSNNKEMTKFWEESVSSNVQFSSLHGGNTKPICDPFNPLILSSGCLMFKKSAAVYSECRTHLICI